MKISIIFTGGTIGSKLNKEGYIDTDASVPYQLLDMYPKKDVDFIIHEPYQILSENLSGNHLSKLISAVSDALVDDSPDGIIVTHGTDTLQYSSAMLEYIFEDCPIPIMLVSSSFVLDDPKANGLVNLSAAVSFIQNKIGKGVFVSYLNLDNCVYFHRGTRLDLPSTLSPDMISVMGSYYASCDRDLSHIKINSKYQATVSAGKLIDSDPIVSDKSPQVLRLRVYPGLDYSQFSTILADCSHSPQAVLLESYHSGTICIDEGLRQFALLCKDNDIPIYLVGLDASAAEYATVSAYNDLGITSLPPCSPIAQYCKLWLAISNNLDIRSIMSRSYGEDWV